MINQGCCFYSHPGACYEFISLTLGAASGEPPKGAISRHFEWGDPVASQDRKREAQSFCTLTKSVTSGGWVGLRLSDDLRVAGGV